MKQIMLVGFLLFILLFAAPSSAQGAVHCGFPGQPYGGFITAPSLVMPINSNQWGQQSASSWNQQLTRNQQTYNNWNSQQIAYQRSNWQYNGGYGQPNQQQQSYGWGQQANPYQMQSGQNNMPSAVGASVGTNQVLSYSQQFNPGDVVTYSCRERSYDKLQGQQNRTCKEDGTWSGYRPWCDINVAYGRSATFADINGASSNTPLITDGIASVDEGAQCILLKRGGGAYFTINLDTQLPVREVVIVGKPGEGMDNLVGSKVTLGTSALCQEGLGNKTSLKYQCNRELYQISQSNQIGNTIRFEHASTFALDVCEVVAYANPTLSDCGEPEIPAHGNATITTNSMDQVVTYACNYGYELRGNFQRTCRGRTWDGQQPTCVEVPVSSTPEWQNTSENPIDGQYPINEAMPVFAIVLIVLCVALAIGLLVAFLVLMKYGKLKCCGIGNKAAKPNKSKSNYVPVTTTSSSTTTPVSATKQGDLKRAAHVEPAIHTELAYVDDRPQRSNARNSAFPELDSEPRNISPRETRPNNDGPHTPTIYAEMAYDQNVNAPGYAKKESDDTSTISSFDEPTRRRDSPKPNRRSYVPPDYAKHSPPEIQMRQKAVNEELSDRISRTTDF